LFVQGFVQTITVAKDKLKNSKMGDPGDGSARGGENMGWTGAADNSRISLSRSLSLAQACSRATHLQQKTFLEIYHINSWTLEANLLVLAPAPKGNELRIPLIYGTIHPLSLVTKRYRYDFSASVWFDSLCKQQGLD
jgi:hypothetical protein